MSIKTRYIVMVVVLLAAVTFIIFLQSSKQDKLIHNSMYNENIIQTKSFSVSADSTDLITSSKGTVFVKGEGDKVEGMRIVAYIEIDPDDWGGVSFSLPAHWVVANITSSYPENATNTTPNEHISTWTTADTDVEWTTSIEIGRDRSYLPTSGGSGTIVIDIMPDQNVNPTEAIQVGVAVGSAIRNGYKVVGTDHIKVPISIVQKEVAQ
ncbi:hypothetical protein [Paenibacillus sp. 2TAB19]|uniref:hypothetical protein n=1 Tax=Paenibacillus sp. 2TAB19 TaxID=3233003 RepID=UPI003F9D1960